MKKNFNKKVRKDKKISKNIEHTPADKRLTDKRLIDNGMINKRITDKRIIDKGVIDKRIVEILKAVLNEIRPDKDVIKDADAMVHRINSALKKNKITAECVKGGSIAKDTFLKNDYDIDLFIRYNPSYRNKDISDISENILKDICSDMNVLLERIHGSRDYFQFDIKKSKNILSFEIIPVILVHAHNYRDADNITDLSPEHVNWVKKYTDKNPELNDEIRLAKQFCKANKVYGAESYINGFSGHILDILVIHYGSFYNFIKAFSRLSDKVLEKNIIIDTEKNLKNPLKQLNKSKITPLIIVDPIQKDRNSAAALKKEKLVDFIEATKSFLENPRKEFFVIKAFDMEKEIASSIKELKLKKGSYDIVRIELDVHEGSKDVVGTKALKAYESILLHTKMYGFDIIKSDWNFTSMDKRAQAYMIIKSGISKDVVQEGPPIGSKEDLKRFLQKHNMNKHKIFYKGSRVYAIIPREFIEPKSFIENLSKKDFIKNKVKGIFIR